MDRVRRIKTLWALILLGTVYGSVLRYRGTITGRDFVDGIIGVLLGLYICSHPAANLVDMLFYSHGVRRPFSSKRAVLSWLALNMIVLLTGCLSIFIGTTRIVGRAG
jgi:hypothetical protein